LKAFIDIGGWKGVSTEFFLKYHPQGREFNTFIFEPDMRLVKVIQAKGLNVIPKAAWINSGTVKFYPATGGTGAGGSVYGNKKTGHVNPKIFTSVECVDIRIFIESLNAEYVVVKMNCEGAEYNLIPHLQGVKVDKWYVQWHWDKIGLSKADHERISSMIKWHPWEVQFNSERFKKEFIKSCDTF